MSEQVRGIRHKGYPSESIKKALVELLTLKPNDPFKFLSGYFQHMSSKSENLFLSFQILTRDFSCLDSALGDVFMLLSKDSLSGVQTKEMLGLCSFFHLSDKHSSSNTCQKYLGHVYKQYSSKKYFDYIGFRQIAEFHTIIYDLGQCLNEKFKTNTSISREEFTSLLKKYEKYHVGKLLLNISFTDLENWNQNNIFDQINKFLRD